MSAGRRAALVVVAAAAVFAAARLLPLADWLGAFQAWVSRHGVWGALLYALVYVAAALLFVPGSLLTIGAGALFGLLWGTVIVSIASTTAAALAFLIARHVARARVERLAERSPTFGAVDHAIRDRGWRVVALLRLSPVVPFSLSNYLYGLTAVGLRHYVPASWAGMLPGTVLYVYLGAAGRAAAAGGGRTPAEWVLLAAGLAATVAVTVLLTRAARRELARSRLAA